MEIPSSIMECCCADPTLLQQINQASVQLSRQARTANDKALRFYQEYCSSVPAYSFFVVPRRECHA